MYNLPSAVAVAPSYIMFDNIDTLTTIAIVVIAIAHYAHKNRHLGQGGVYLESWLCVLSVKTPMWMGT
jgi:hypothetical protein